MKQFRKRCLPILFGLMLLVSGCAQSGQSQGTKAYQEPPNAEAQTQVHDAKRVSMAKQTESFSLSDVPEYSGQPYVTIYENTPFFRDTDFTTNSFEIYSDLDEHLRCQTAFANIGADLMPTEDRERIGQVKPSGWHTIKYENVDGKYLYNRCHLIGYQLTAENANEKNLITGTRYLNVEGMLPFENMVADYIKETNHHVLYRVTPVFEGDNLIASGVRMEAESVEDEGEGICFHVFVYNVQPGITIDYATGDSWLSDTQPGRQETETRPAAETQSPKSQETAYILNTSTHKFHIPSCSGVSRMKESNKESVTCGRDEVISQGYEPCQQCNP